MRDYMIRRDQAAARRADAPCGCGHPLRCHRELEREALDLEASIAAGECVFRANPDYRPLHFHCTAPGCECVRRPAA